MATPAQTAQVAQMYVNILGRQADADGLAYWSGALADSGSPSLIEAALASSNEGQAALAEIYQAVLGRAPYQAEQAAGAYHLSNGGSLAQVQATLASSDEAQSDISAIYQSVLNRGTDISGAAYFTQVLANGGSLTEVRADLAYSQEAQNNISNIFQYNYYGQAQSVDISNSSSFLAKGYSFSDLTSLLVNYNNINSNVNSIFNIELNRYPEAGVSEYFTDNIIFNGSSLSNVAFFIAASPESQANIVQSYQDILNRNPNSAEINASVQILASGGALTSFQNSLAFGSEAQSDVNSIIQTYFGAPPSVVDLNADLSLLVSASYGGVGPRLTLAQFTNNVAAAAAQTSAVTQLLQTDFGTAPTTAAINAALVELSCGLSFADLTTQEGILSQNPSVVKSNGGVIILGSGPAIIDETTHSYDILNFDASKDIIAISRADITSYTSLSETIYYDIRGVGYGAISSYNSISSSYFSLSLQSNPAHPLTPANIQLV